MRENAKKIVAFGEIMLRLSPENCMPIKDAHSFSACYGGSEANVLVCLSALGFETEFLSVIPYGGVGDGAVKHLRGLGVGTDGVVRKGESLGIYFLEQGFGERASVVTYNRKEAAIRSVTTDDFDCDKFFDGAAVFYVSGITLALSESCRDTALYLAKKAKQRGISVAFDFNYRSKLWTAEEAAKAYAAIMPQVDVCFGNDYDLKTFLGLEGECEDDVYRAFFEKYGARCLCHTKRNAVSSSVNELAGYVKRCVDGKIVTESAGPYRFEILDRVGAGDCFDAGVLGVLIEDEADYAKAVKTGLACDVLKHTVKGDAFLLNRDAVDAFLSGKGRDVRR